MEGKRTDKHERMGNKQTWINKINIGEWNDEEILKAKYIRGNPKQVALCLQSLFAAASSELVKTNKHEWINKNKHE